MIRVVVADDQTLVRAGFRVLVDSAPDLEVVGEAGDGLEATRRIVADELLAGARVLILTTFDLDEYVYDAIRAGASGFLLKDVTAEGLFEAVRVVAAGDALLAPSVTRRLISRFADIPVDATPDPTTNAAVRSLTARETQVLRLVAEGMSNSEIAVSLTVTEETVKTHVSRLLAKLQLRDRTQAVVLAYESGLVVRGARLSRPL